MDGLEVSTTSRADIDRQLYRPALEAEATDLLSRGDGTDRFDGGAHIGALGPRMVELAGEIADGLILTTVTPEHARVMLEPIHRADFDVIATVPLALDAPEAMARARESLAAYGVIDVYNRHLVRQGFETEARALREAWERRSWSDAVAAVSDHMLDALCISGDLAKCREGIERYREAGVKTLIITPVARFSESLAALKGNL